MKKYKKKEILDIIGVLKDTNENIRKKGNGVTQEDIIDILSQCQETAIVLGNYFETFGKITVSLIKVLENYCEDIYQMSIELSDDCQFQKLSKKIKKQLIQLYNKVRDEFSDDKKEIVFLPYKASMWDSFESVWKAADEDESCEVYVIPIPYFDKNIDGTLGRMHYEGNAYPEYVPITSWEDYLIEERKPDVIYIHNPYDNNNIITTVHPAFYAKKLKNYTDMLVYIPYFVCAGDTIQKHFCVLPGTLYADKVIVQSETIRKTYVEELHKFERNNNCKNVYGNIEQKILALGSPKYDKLLNTKKESLDIPEEWKYIIYSSDGTKKKVILYNTSIAVFLEKSDEIIAKIKNIINLFKDRQGEFVLLWRPHPLMPATLQSMRPHLWNEYSGIVSSYKSEGWGIFDESGDVDRAIIISDAYYGDGGSLFALYEKTGKLMMVQNAEFLG
ncbi:hypothetical protein [Lacrimispora sp.]|uniref:hypothetical protein n=1 Tax=Lacrimispora sp. TaxID=2719234 RepID=UPI002FDAC0C3